VDLPHGLYRPKAGLGTNSLTHSADLCSLFVHVSH
jgi:hypothetical protein